MGFFRIWKQKVESNVEELGRGERINLDPLLLEQYPDAVYILNRDLEIIDINEKLALMFGGEGKNFLFTPKWLPQRETERIHRFHTRALQGETVHYEITTKNKQGRLIHFSVTNTPLYAGQIIIGLYGVVKDLTAQVELREHYNRLKVGKELFERIPGLILIEMNTETETFYHSPQTADLLGLSKRQLKEMRREHFRELIHEEDRLGFSEAINRLLEDPNSFEYESQLRIYNPNERLYSDFIVKVGVSKDRKSITWAMFDISNLLLVETELLKERKKVRELCEIVDSVILEHDFTTEQFKFLTPGFSTIFGYSEEQFNIQSNFWRKVVIPDDLPKLQQAREVTLTGKKSTFSYRIFAKEEVKWVEETREPLFNQKGDVFGFRTLVKDITELKEQQQEIWRLATLDSVTNMPNRESITDTVYQLVRKREPFTLFSLSFNRIAEINHTFGYEAGDAWRIVTINELIRLLPTDACLGHLDADNVLIILPRQMDDQEVLTFGETLGALSHHQFRIDVYDLHANISIGVSRFPNDGEQVSQLIKHACVAMNRAYKKDETYLELYSSHMNIEALRRYELLRDMSAALNKNEFYLVYQPKVNAWTGKIVGAEALLRWNHPTWESISPTEFIPLAEESNFHIRLTDWVIEETCRFIKSLVRPIPISINVSAKYLYRENVDHTLERLMDTYQISPLNLEIEISETSLLEDPAQVTRSFKKINDLGVAIAFDDFGKGYSSLAYLQTYHAQTIKIDRIFAHGISESRKKQGIIRSLLLLAEEFEMNVVVEGVERIEDMLLLRDLGGHVIQGYLYSRPITDSEFQHALQIGTLHPIEEFIEPLESSNRFIHAGITITSLRNQPVSVGTSPIVIMRRNFKSLGFYSSTRLPVDSEISLVVILEDEQDPFSIQIQRVTELANGLYQYEASYSHTLHLEKRLTTFEREKPRNLSIEEPEDLLSFKPF